MTSRPKIITTFAVSKIIQPIYTGGDAGLSRNGQVLVTCLGEEALLTNLDTGQLLARVEGDGEVLTALLVTPSVSHLITCSRSLSMRVYSLEPSNDSPELLNPVLQRTLKPHTTPVITAAVDRTGTLLATGGADGVIKVWDINGGYVTHTFRGHAGVISALHFFEAHESVVQSRTSTKQRRKSQRLQEDDDCDGHTVGAEEKEGSALKFYLASGSEDGKIRIWDLIKRKAIITLDSHVSVVRSLCFSREQNALLSGSRDKTAIIWEPRTWKAMKVVPVLEGLETAGFLSTGEFFYTGGESNILRIWETETGREVTKEQVVGTEDSGILHILYNSSLDFLVTVHTNQTLVIHSLVPLLTLQFGGKLDPLPILRHLSGTHDEIIDLSYVTQGRELLALATNSEDIRLVSLAARTDTISSATGQYFGADVALLQGHEDIIICLDVDWSGCWLATGAKDNTARLWRIDHMNQSYESFAVFTGHAESLGAISLPNQPPPVGSTAHSNPLDHPPSFLLTGSQDRTVKRWEVVPKSIVKGDKRNPRAIYTRKAHDKDINAIATNHNSTLFASASQDRTVKIWAVEEGEVQGVLRGHRRGVWSVKFAAKETPPITGDSGPASSSRGLVLTGSGDKTVKIWSLSDYSCLRTLEGHTNSVLKVIWMPLSQHNNDTEVQEPSRHRGVQIASAGGDGLVKIWDANSGECDCTLDNHTDRVWALTVNPSDSTVISGGGDSVVTFWKDTTSSTIAASAAASTARVEQEQQLQNYIHHGSYREAITLALQLNHPARLLALLTTVVNTNPPEPTSLSGLLAVDDVLQHLADEQLFTLLLRLRDWNTNARTAPVAQRILWVLAKSYPATRLAGLKGRGKGSGLKDVLDGLRAYTERHYKRMEELVDESYLVDYTLREMEAVGFVDEDIAMTGVAA
ncbi:U3 small nucleolar RNA-associated protein 13 [Xylographa pallens]|nr:U3 small nucleolar RNA-associated protein 13 [Xylographa pallens]